MKCINRMKTVLAGILAVVLCTGCGSSGLVKEYKSPDNGSVWKEEQQTQKMQGMAEELCVENDEIIPDGMEPMAGAAGLFDLSGRQVLYASQIHQKMYPASITKIMTALVFLEQYQGNYMDVVTVTGNAKVTESGAVVCGYKTGDKVTVEQLLNGLLIYSGNDAALILAEYCAGSVDEFIGMMNRKAIELGATNTHFVNPHGLHDEEHYTTAYDLYLIFQKVMQYDKFREIINTKEYSGEYTLASGGTKKVSWKSTNQFFTGNKQVPEGVVVIGGKTGTTNAAGACLILLAQNSEGADYISIVLREENKDFLYEDMIKLLGRINN